ncbi:MAG: phasin family protein [Parvularculaceae bacterium]
MAANESGNGAETVNVGNHVFPLFEPKEFARLSQRNVEIMSQAARAYFNGATEMNKEIAEFFSRRVKKDLETVRSVMSSNNGQDALNAQTGFFEEAMRDYSAETSRMFKIAADAASDALKTAEH